MSSPIVQIAVLARHRHPRLRYVLREVGRSLGQKWTLFTDADKWIAAAADVRFTYGVPSPGPRAVALPAHPFLAGVAPAGEDLVVRASGGLPCFFAAPHATDVTAHDLLACIFFQLSRYEEYGSPYRDAHGRYPATASHAVQYGYLRQPVARLMAHQLYAYARARQPRLPAPGSPPYYFQPSYDIDLLWAYQHRGWKGVASGVRDLATGQLRRALARWFRPATADPYNILEDLIGLHRQHQPGPDASLAIPTPVAPLATDTRPMLFWLLADNKDRRDVNPYPIPPAQIEVMRKLLPFTQSGLHPGYRSSDDPRVLREELLRYRSITGHSPIASRQHFLKFNLPHTYRALHTAGIRHEHSMGYADAIGWRAGTNLPFTWYDLEREEATYFTVHPFAAMDVTLKNYHGYSPAEARREVAWLAEPIRDLGGPFCLLWHNSSFADAHGWAGWKKMYYELVTELHAPII